LFRIISLNANGIRAAARKGFFDWMAKQDADVICIQETKAQVHQLVDECFSPAGYHCYYEDAVKKGYSGVAVYTRHKPKKVVRGYGDKEFDDEGRYLEVQLEGINVVSLYLPSGSSSEERQVAKYRCMDSFTEHLNKLRRKRSQTVICGDWNIVHKEEDITKSRNPTSTRGGQIAVVPGTTTWAGVSITMSLHQGFVNVYSGQKFTRTNGSRIMRH
jgi:exodeoxyribonuclease-3